MRYEAEIDLRFVGDEAECQKYIAQARKVLGEVWNRDLEIGALEQSWRTVPLDKRATVVVYATRYHNPVVTIIVEPVEPTEKPVGVADLRLTWMPEGIAFTPVSEEYEDGWGLPTRHHETGEILPFLDPESGDPLHPAGTEGGVWPQVMVNKFVNNKYLDDPAYVTGLEPYLEPSLVTDNPLLREGWETPYNIDGQTRFNSWQILYNPLDCVVDLDNPEADPGTEFWNTTGNLQYGQIPGVYDTSNYASGQLVNPQFGGYLVDDVIFEPPSADWHAHRAEELLYYTPAQEAIFQYTNELRTTLGLGRMHRIVRGHANTARISVSEVALSGKQFHDSVEHFRPGYAYMYSRSRSARGTGVGDGENLLITSNVGLDWDSGIAVAEAWENSPVHYANMVNVAWTETEDVPGAEHFIDFISATVDETVSSGELDPAAAGVEWAQIFSIANTWVPCPYNYNLTTTGSVGNFGKVSRHDRDGYYGPDYLYLSYRQVLYVIPNELFTEGDSMGVFGASEFVVPEYDVQGFENENAGERRLRAVVGTSDYMLDPLPGQVKDYTEFKLYVITMPLANTGDCDWEIEAEQEYLFEDGWIPAMEGQVKFSPNGKKFVFTMLNRSTYYNEALDFDAENFTTERSYLHNNRRSVELHHVVFDADRPNGEWFTADPQLAPFALVNCGTSGAPSVNLQHYYRRSLVGEINAFPDWDDNNDLIYIKLVIQERSDQLYTYGNEVDTHNFMYTIRKMVFPSGKEIVYHQQYMRDVVTVENPAEIVLNGWPEGDETGDPFFLMFHYINTRDEDVVYTRRETRVRLAIRSGQGYPDNYEYGGLSIHADCGWDEVDPETNEAINTRHREEMYTVPDGFFNDYRVAPEFSEFVDEEGWVGLNMETSANIYQTDVVVPAVRAYDVAIGQIVIPVRAFMSVPVPGIKVGTDVEEQIYTEAEHVRGAYNAYPNKIVDNLIGRPPFAGYHVSCIYGIQQRWPERFMGTNYFWGSSVWDDSFMPTNVAPVINSEYVSLCQVVRYEERIMVRLENRKWPWATVKDFTVIGTAPGLPTPIVASTDRVGAKPDWDTVPDDAQILLWANFDIDEAAGIEDVTDIQPFGRVG